MLKNGSAKCVNVSICSQQAALLIIRSSVLTFLMISLFHSVYVPYTKYRFGIYFLFIIGWTKVGFLIIRPLLQCSVSLMEVKEGFLKKRTKETSV